jgi:uncharacterized protein (DUF362 family)
MKIEKVGVVKCSSYEQEKVDRAVERLIKLINFDFSKFSGKTVLIKPNIVGCFPKKQIATTTHPSIVEAVCKILKKNHCKILIGDSPFTDPDSSFKASGIDKVAKKYGKMIVFEQDKLVKVHDKNAKILKDFEIAKSVKDADLIINMPKLKTHSLTKFTGAVKNLYGLIPGGLKQRIHVQAKGDNEFSNILIDIYQNIMPELTIMDGVIGMEGNGPTSGEAVKTKVILASKNGIALDVAATKMINLNPRSINTSAQAIKRKLYPKFDFIITGDKLPSFNFKTPSNIEKTKQILRHLFKEKPIICDSKKCIKCAKCMKHCPTSSITMTPYPVVNPKTCIRCFCCIEICPTDAMGFKKDN